MHLTWNGHSTWQVELDDTRLLIDPFFDNPYTSREPSDIEAPDYLLLTHGHADHIGDVDAFADRSTVVATPELATWMEQERDAAETIGMNIGGTVECGDAFVTMVQAYHTNGIDMDPAWEVGLPTGYVISDTSPEEDDQADATSFYHAGDTALMSEMRDVIRPFLRPDAAALPIGDHFTMGPRQAAIAVDWLGVDHAFPMHYDTFPLIEQDSAAFADAVKAQGSGAEVHSLDADVPFELT